MDGYLTELSDSLAPSEEFLRRGNEIMNRIVTTIQADGKYSIDRVRLGGGLQKKTSLKHCADYDLVAFLNGTSPDVEVLKHFKTVISEEFQLDDKIVKKKGKKRVKKAVKIFVHSLQMTLEGVKFDLLFARNMVKTNSEDSLVRKQHAGILEQVSRANNPTRAAADNSAALTEAAVDFVKQQSPFVHKVARLAKYWNSTIDSPERWKISGRSSIFELLGITAGREEEQMNTHSPSIANAFKGFLEKVVALKKQRIMYFDYYDESDVPNNIKMKTPLLLDPSSPYNNFMLGFPRPAMKLFSECARESLDRFQTDIRGSVHMHLNTHKAIQTQKKKRRQAKKH